MLNVGAGRIDASGNALAGEMDRIIEQCLDTKVLLRRSVFSPVSPVPGGASFGIVFGAARGGRVCFRSSRGTAEVSTKASRFRVVGTDCPVRIRPSLLNAVACDSTLRASANQVGASLKPSDLPAVADSFGVVRCLCRTANLQGSQSCLAYADLRPMKRPGDAESIST